MAYKTASPLHIVGFSVKNVIDRTADIPDDGPRVNFFPMNLNDHVEDRLTSTLSPDLMKAEEPNKNQIGKRGSPLGDRGVSYSEYTGHVLVCVEALNGTNMNARFATCPTTFPLTKCKTRFETKIGRRREERPRCFESTRVGRMSSCRLSTQNITLV